MVNKRIKFIALLLVISSIIFSCSSSDFKSKLVLNYISIDSANYFISVHPKKTEAVIILFPGLGEVPEDLFAETDIIESAYKNNIATIIPYIQNGMSLYIDSNSLRILTELISAGLIKYNFEDMPIIHGGFSIGGNAALLYAENQFSKKSSLPNQIKGIFIIDSPLDMKRFYSSLDNTIRYSKSTVAINEAKYLKKRMRAEAGITSNSSINNFNRISPFLYKDTLNKAIKLLKDIPIRAYIEPAILWQMQKRDRDYYDMNTIDCAAFINRLNAIGNKNAKLIVSSNLGHRNLTNTKNPHSWSILDGKELISWIQSITKNKQ